MTTASFRAKLLHWRLSSRIKEKKTFSREQHIGNWLWFHGSVFLNQQNFLLFWDPRFRRDQETTQGDGKAQKLLCQQC